MQIEIVAIVLSIVSTVVAFVDLYLNQFRRGRVAVPPLRVYRLEPLNFHADGDSYRAVRLIAPLTFVNTGALYRVVDNLRVRVPVPGAGQDIFLEWRNEHESVEQPSHESKLATQPTLGPYGSISKVYSFVSRTEPAVGKHVSHIEAEGTEHPESPLDAAVEMLSGDRWVPLRRFKLRYRGANYIETDFGRING